ncbi:MAG: ABC transporter permease [Spirochaetales bacterium]|nr:ABC transporter permease [Spirochaetales bacterium]
MKLQVTPRQTLTRGNSILIPLFSLIGGFALVSIVFLVKGINPFFALFSIFHDSFGSIYGIKETIRKAIPLILVAGGLCVVFQGKYWNIGAEGQLLMGAAFATWLALKLGNSLPGPVMIPLILLGGFIGGALWALPPAILKTRFNINEVISTLMFNYISFEIISYLCIGPWKGPSKSGFPYTEDFPESARLAFLPGTRIHYFTLIVALLFAVILFFLIYRTSLGYEIRVSGENIHAARYAGISVFRTTLISMIISGGVAGIAGMGEVAGVHFHLSSYSQNISAGYGFTAIIVAWLARLNPLLAIISSLFFAGLLVGGDAIQITLNLPAATVDVFNGILLFSLIIGEYFRNNSIRMLRGK